jgi:hypothetical protein
MIVTKVKNKKYTLIIKLPKIDMDKIPQEVKDKWERIALEFLNEQRDKNE